MTVKLFGTPNSKKVLYCHGGAFVKPDGPADDRFCDQLAKAAQCEVGSIDYPLSEPIGDVLSAISLELDKSGPCILIGTSAGACASAMLNHRNIKAVVAISGYPTFRWAMSLEGRDERLLANFLGVLKVKSASGRAVLTRHLPQFRTTIPPTLIIHGGKDPRFPIAYIREYASKAAEDHQPVNLIINPDMDHGIENGFARMTEIREFVGGHT